MYVGQGLEFQSKLLTSCWLRSTCHWRRVTACASHASWVSCTLSLTMSRGISGLFARSSTHQRAHASNTVVRIFRTALLQVFRLASFLAGKLSRGPRSLDGLADLAEPY